MGCVPVLYKFSLLSSNGRASDEGMFSCNPYLARDPERKLSRAYFNKHIGNDVTAVSGEARNQLPSALQSQLIISHPNVLLTITMQGVTP